MKKKLLLLTFTFALSIIFIPNVHALTLEKVELLQPEDTYIEGTPKVEGNGTTEVTITYEQASFRMVEKDLSIHRDEDGAWAGVRVYAPKDLTNDQLQKAQYRHSTTEEQYTNWWENRDSKSKECEQDKIYYFDYYGFITKDILEQFAQTKSSFRYTWLIDWDGDKVDDQTVNLIINPQGMTLYDLKKNNNNEPIWAEEEYLEASNQVKVTYNVTIDKNSGFSHFLYVDKNTKLEEGTLRKILEENYPTESYEILGYYTEDTMDEEFDFSQPLTENTTIYVNIGSKEVIEEDKGPDTADMNVFGLLSLILVSGVTLTYVFRKRMN